MTETRNRARINILNALLSSPAVSGHKWNTMVEPIVGDLVSLCAAPYSKWYLSWVLEVKTESEWTKYLLESIEDGTTSWWSNVGVNVYKKEHVGHSWRWTDRQFDFMDKWFRVGKKNDAYMVLCVPPIFDGDKVTLKTRIRLNLNESYDGNPRTFDNWKKLKSSEMDVHYKDSVKKYEQLKKQTSK